MKLRNTIALSAFVLVAWYGNISCKKLLDKIADCRIETITEPYPSGNRVSTIAYNNDGNISTYTVSFGSTLSSKVFNYSGNTIIINTTISSGSGSTSYMDSVTTNGQGRALNLRQYSADRSTFTNTRFEYNGEDLVRLYQTNETGDPAVLTTVTTTNGNVVRLESASGTAILEYYANEEFQEGDYLHIVTLSLYGVPIYPHKNLIKTIDDGTGNIVNFSYEKNIDGLVTKVNVTSATSVSSYSYTYKCD